MNASTRLQGADVLPPLTPRQMTTQGPPAKLRKIARAIAGNGDRAVSNRSFVAVCLTGIIDVGYRRCRA